MNESVLPAHNNPGQMFSTQSQTDGDSNFFRNQLLIRFRPFTIFSDNLVGILSRVAEALGPLKPQQPVDPWSMLVLTPTRSGRER
jgi:hypothetical protein